MPDGTISTQVSPGARVIGVPSEPSSRAGWEIDERDQVPEIDTPLRSTSTGPPLVGSTSTSWAPSEFSTQGPVHVSTVMITTLVTPI